MNRHILQKFPVRFIPTAVNITYEIKIRTIHIELPFLECCWHRDPNLEISQLQAHSNIGRMECLPPGRDECNVFPGHYYVKVVDILCIYKNCFEAMIYSYIFVHIYLSLNVPSSKTSVHDCWRKFIVPYRISRKFYILPWNCQLLRRCVRVAEIYHIFL
jgi:hypothetical protein